MTKSLAASMTEVRAGTAAALIRAAIDSGLPLERTRYLADAQRQLGLALRSAFAECEQGHETWAAVGQVTGMPRETVYRQYASGGPIAAIRATHQHRQEPSEIEAVYTFETEDGTWYGPHTTLAPDDFASAVLPFQPADPANRFSGQVLRVRIGPRPAAHVSVHAARMRLADGSAHAARLTDEVIGLLFEDGLSHLRVALANAYYAVTSDEAADGQLHHAMTNASQAIGAAADEKVLLGAILEVLATVDAGAHYSCGAAAAIDELRRAIGDYYSWRAAEK